MKKILTALVVGMTLAGCASSGNQSLRDETEASVSAKLTEGKTTRSEVQQMFGSPYQTSFTSEGEEIWTYQLDNLQADAVNFIPVVGALGTSHSGKRKQLVVLFNNKNIVRRYSMTDSDVSVKTGVFR